MQLDVGDDRSFLPSLPQVRARAGVDRTRIVGHRSLFLPLPRRSSKAP
jgi:hypothetical protein